MSSKPTKGHIGPVSIVWALLIVLVAALEGIMLAIGEKGGALSHVVWWANDVDDGLYSWRWALVSGPLAGFLLWCVPHFLWGAGNGLHLILWVVAVTTVLAVLVLTR